MKKQSTSPKIVYHVIFPLWAYLLIYGCLLAAICGITEKLNHLSRGALLRWSNGLLSSYWYFLNTIFSFMGWRRGFGSFWSLHPKLAVAIFLAIPLLGIVATIFILKRERLAAQIALLLYAWHVGVSNFVNTKNISWKILFFLSVSAASLILIIRLGYLVRRKFSRRNHSTSEFDNRGNVSVFLNQSKNMTHGSNNKSST